MKVDITVQPFLFPNSLRWVVVDAPRPQSMT